MRFFHLVLCCSWQVNAAILRGTTHLNTTISIVLELLPWGFVEPSNHRLLFSICHCETVTRRKLNLNRWSSFRFSCAVTATVQCHDVDVCGGSARDVGLQDWLYSVDMWSVFLSMMLPVMFTSGMFFVVLMIISMGHRLVRIPVVYCFLFLPRGHLHDEVRIGPQSKLLKAHVDVWI